MKQYLELLRRYGYNIESFLHFRLAHNCREFAYCADAHTTSEEHLYWCNVGDVGDFYRLPEFLIFLFLHATPPSPLTKFSTSE